MTDTMERRLGERVVLSPPLRGVLAGCEVSILDIGRFGARVRQTGARLGEGPATLTFEWDDGPIAVDCRTVYSHRPEVLDPNRPDIFEAGVQFVRADETSRGFRRMLSTLAEREEIEHLKRLIDASKLINSSIEASALFASILTVSRSELGVERGTLYFVDDARQEIWSRIAEHAPEIRLPMGQGLAGTVAATGVPLVLHDAYADPRFDRSQDQRSGFRTTSMLCVPIRNRDGTIVGVLQLLNKIRGSFGDKDMRFLDAIADHMAIAMDNATLHLDLVEKNRMERELQLGRAIQSHLLPSPPAGLPGLEIAATCRPCYEVGGDYYDFIELPGGNLGLTIGDVSGKGVAAALIMSSVQAALRLAAPVEAALPMLAERLNALIYRMAEGRKYATFFFGRFDPGTGELRYVNAGHNPPFVGSADGLRVLEATGRPIGILPDSRFEESSVVIEPGHGLVLYTDGLTEATNPTGEEFGMDRLADLIRGCAGDPTAGVPQRIVDAITAFEDGVHANDDKTVVVMRRTG